ncbi:hypothetical protein Tco_1216623 [Tanacetum coccineum]
MKDALSLMGRSKGVFRRMGNETYQLPPEPSRQEEFEHIVMNFIHGKEKRVEQLEEYMKIIIGDFMKLSSKLQGEVICNIPYWLSKYLKGVRDKKFIYRGMFVTRIARSFGLLTNEMRDALSIEPPPHLFKKKSLIAMGIIMELQNGICVWHAVRAVEGEEEAEEEAEGEAANEGAGGFAEMYRNMSQGDWQVRQARWMDQQDERWEKNDAWKGK